MSMYQPVNKAVFKNASVMMEGDTKNEIIVKLMDKDGAAVDLAGKTVTWTAANDRGKLINNRPAAIYLGGEVGIKFLESDSFGDGVIYIQFSVTWAAGQIERFPADNNLFMKVSGSHENVRYAPVNYVTIEQIESELSAKFDEYALTVQQGAKGDPGAGLVILGTLTSTAQLPTSTTDGNAYLINGDLHVYANGNWTNAGRIQGPKGDTGNTGATGPAGIDGTDGINGKSLQFAWNGYQLGTRIEGDTTYIYSQSLRGATGATGSQGPQGIKGDTGNTGLTGATGAAGKNLEYSWNGYQLGVRQQGETTYTYSTSLRGATGATGSQGIQGIQGIPGIKGDKGETGNTGPQGIQGIPGIKGDKGDTGAGLNIKGSFTSTAQLPATGAAGDAYLIGGALYVWGGSSWTNAGNIQGPAGEAGPIGETGPAGKNLEFLWTGYTLGVRQQGNATYTYSQSLRGATGATGTQGIQGIQGIQGPAGTSLEFLWNGTQLGIRQVGAPSYTYVDLKGAKGDTGNTGLTGQTGQTGAAGKNLEFLWNGTQLGVRQEGQSTYTYVNLQGPQGIQGIKGDKGDTGNTGLKGDTGIQGIQGIQGVAGKNLEFLWSGTTLGVRQQGTTPYTYSASLQGPQGIQGIQGIKGDKGDTGNTGSPGTNATLNIELRTSDPASPAAGQVWLRTDLTT